jgi:uncharacterized protein YbbK (DUF523 family)
MVSDPAIKVGISACLLGREVRYDGGHRLDVYLLGKMPPSVVWVPVCPESEAGLPVPRDVMHLVGSPEAPRIITIESGIDHTELILGWTEKKLEALQMEGLSGFILKSRSPSCGLREIPVEGPDGRRRTVGRGLFAAALVQNFPGLPVEDEEGLRAPNALKDFLDRLSHRE